jgi:hypothetical protein
MKYREKGDNRKEGAIKYFMMVILRPDMIFRSTESGSLQYAIEMYQQSGQFSCQ